VVFFVSRVVIVSAHGVLKKTENRSAIRHVPDNLIL
jgi:hypothetical protein